MHGTIVGWRPRGSDEHDGDDDGDDDEPSAPDGSTEATEDQRETARVFRIALESGVHKEMRGGARLRRALVKGSLDGEFMHVTDLRDDDIVGKNVEVLWPDDGLFYPATVISARAVAPGAPTTSATEKAREAEETKSDTGPNEDDDATLAAQLRRRRRRRRSRCGSRARAQAQAEEAAAAKAAEIEAEEARIAAQHEAEAARENARDAAAR